MLIHSDNDSTVSSKYLDMIYVCSSSGKLKHTNITGKVILDTVRHPHLGVSAQSVNAHTALQFSMYLY